MTEGTERPAIGVVTEAFANRSLTEVMDWLAREAPLVTELEIGTGGYAPTGHCDMPRLLRDAGARNAWLGEVGARPLRVGALNVWGNPLHPDPAIPARHHPARART